MDTLDDAVMSHFIPSVHLTGSRDEELRKLDGFIHHLLQLRDVLSGNTTAKRVVVHGYRRFRGPSALFTGGLITGVPLALTIEALIRWVL